MQVHPAMLMKRKKRFQVSGARCQVSGSSGCRRARHWSTPMPGCPQKLMNTKDGRKGARRQRRRRARCACHSKYPYAGISPEVDEKKGWGNGVSGQVPAGWRRLLGLGVCDPEGTWTWRFPETPTLKTMFELPRFPLPPTRDVIRPAECAVERKVGRMVNMPENSEGVETGNTLAADVTARRAKRPPALA